MTPMGRPKAENPKDKQIGVRLDKETLEKLDECAKYYQETRVQILRRGIYKVYEDIKK